MSKTNAMTPGDENNDKEQKDDGNQEEKELQRTHSGSNESMPLRSILRMRELPLTVFIEKTDLARRNHGLCTIHATKKVLQLEVVENDGGRGFCHLNIDSRCTSVSVDPSVLYRTLGDVIDGRKNDQITWFVGTSCIHTENACCQVGQIFTFAPVSLRRSFRRAKRSGVMVLKFPSMNKIFLPLDAEGNFYKCQSPTEATTHAVHDLVSVQNHPMVLQVEQGCHGDEVMFAHAWVVVGVVEVEVVYSSKKCLGTLQVHVFSTYDGITVNVKEDDKPVDNLDVNELRDVINFIPVPRGIDLRQFYRVMSYQQLGITRLLEEIFDELSVRCSSSDFCPMKTTSCRGFDTCFLKSISLPATGMTSSSLPTSNGLVGYVGSDNSCKKRSLSLDDSNKLLQQQQDQEQELEDHYSQCSENVTPDKGVSKIDEDIVDIDDSGYVIVPVGGSSPDSCDSTNVGYKRSDNEAYGYNFNENEDFDDHIYAYIKPLVQHDIDAVNIKDNVIDSSVRYTSNKNVVSNISSLKTLSINILQKQTSESVKLQSTEGIKSTSNSVQSVNTNDIKLTTLSDIKTNMTSNEARVTRRYEYPQMCHRHYEEVRIPVPTI